MTNCNRSKIWIDKSSEVYNRSVKSWLQDNHIELYSTHNAGKSVVAETLIGMVSISKRVLLI